MMFLPLQTPGSMCIPTRMQAAHKVLSTQCAAIAHFTDGLSGPVRHRRYLRAKKKLKKQQ